jgi:uncharacterized RDD family membrane protein YckC
MKKFLENFQSGYKYKVDRISAYLIDLLLIAFLVTFLMSNSITNPFYENTIEACNAYSEVSKTEKKDLDYSDSKSVTNYVKKVSPYHRTCYIRRNYASYVWYVLLTIFYFGLFAYLNDGQTIGKKLLRLRVVNNKDGKNAKFIQLLFRNIFGGDVLLTGTGNNFIILLYLFLPFIKNGYAFTISLSILIISTYVLDFLFIILFIFKKNGRTLDDLVGSTKVIRVEKKRVSKEN